MKTPSLTIPRHAAELLVANLLFFVFQWLAGKAAALPLAEPVKVTVLLSPCLPVLLMVATLKHYFQDVDEYLRLRFLENLAITAAVIFVGAFIFGELEVLGMRPLNWSVVCPAMAVVFTFVHLARREAAR